MSRTLRVGEYLVGRACRRLPAKVREERFAEWAAELPAILEDREARWARARMLAFALDQARGARRLGPRERRRPAGRRLRLPDGFRQLSTRQRAALGAMSVACIGLYGAMGGVIAGAFSFAVRDGILIGLGVFIVAALAAWPIADRLSDRSTEGDR